MQTKKRAVPISSRADNTTGGSTSHTNKGPVLMERHIASPIPKAQIPKATAAALPTMPRRENAIIHREVKKPPSSTATPASVQAFPVSKPHNRMGTNIRTKNTHCTRPESQIPQTSRREPMGTRRMKLFSLLSPAICMPIMAGTIPQTPTISHEVMVPGFGSSPSLGLITTQASRM